MIFDKLFDPFVVEDNRPLAESSAEAKKDIEMLMKRLDSIESDKLDKILKILDIK